MFIFDEPFLASMLLFHTKSGDILGRVWNKTVSRGRAVVNGRILDFVLTLTTTYSSYCSITKNEYLHM